MFTQKRRGKLRGEREAFKALRSHSEVAKGEFNPSVKQPNLLVFQMCRVSGSEMPRLSACSSRKSKKYLTARGGRSGGMLRMA